jgi:hypothetical protein
MLRERAAALIRESFPSEGLWGFKDPRLAFTLPFWRDVIPGLRCVICLRNPAEVAASLARFPGFEHAAPRDAERLWFRSVAHALVATKDIPRTLVSYERYFTDLELQIRQIATFIGRPPTPSTLREIEAFVDRNSRHHWLSADTADEHVLPEARALFTALSRSSGIDLDAAEHEARRLMHGRWWRRSGRPRARGIRAASPAPVSLSRFPDDLLTPGLRMFGIHLDGWLSQAAYVALRGGAAADLLLSADVLPANGQALVVLVNSRLMARVDTAAGRLDLRIPVPASAGLRHIELRWTSATTLHPPDPRVVAALLVTLVVSSDFERELARPGRLRRLANEKLPRLRQAIGNALT